MDMVRTVAEALAKSRGVKIFDEVDQQLFERDARAAIEAMREPTEMMCEAGNDTGAVENGVFRISNRAIATVYRAMIDAALNPQTPT